MVWSEGRVFFSALKCIPPRPLGVQDGQEKEQGEMDHEGLVSKSKKDIVAIDITAAAAIVLQLLLLVGEPAAVGHSSFDIRRHLVFFRFLVAAPRSTPSLPASAPPTPLAASSPSSPSPPPSTSTASFPPSATSTAASSSGTSSPSSSPPSGSSSCTTPGRRGKASVFLFRNSFPLRAVVQSDGCPVCCSLLDPFQT